MRTAEEWVRWYIARREDAGATALDLLDSRGIVYALVCRSTSRDSRKARKVSEGACSSRRKQQTKDGGYVCARCGDPWPYEIRFLLRGVVQTSTRPDYFEHRISTQVDVGRAFSRLVFDPELRRRKEGRLFVATALGHPIRSLSTNGPKAWPDLPPPWGRTEIAEAALRGRNRWIDELSAVGIDSR